MFFWLEACIEDNILSNLPLFKWWKVVFSQTLPSVQWLSVARPNWALIWYTDSGLLWISLLTNLLPRLIPNTENKKNLEFIFLVIFNLVIIYPWLQMTSSQVNLPSTFECHHELFEVHLPKPNLPCLLSCWHCNCWLAAPQAQYHKLPRW